jgi:hypothetical protein
MGKYLNPKADLTFKKIFGENKHLVISLLNALLPLEDDNRVESIEYSCNLSVSIAKQQSV